MERGNMIAPMEINHAMGSIFIVRTDLANKVLSDTVEMAEIDEIKLVDIYNDVENGRIIINRNMSNPQERTFEYSYRGIYKTASDAKIGAAEVNRRELQKLERDEQNLYKALENIDKLKKFFKDELPKTGLI